MNCEIPLISVSQCTEEAMGFLLPQRRVRTKTRTVMASEGCRSHAARVEMVQQRIVVLKRK